jgi:hypothetical protein
MFSNIFADNYERTITRQRQQRYQEQQQQRYQVQQQQRALEQQRYQVQQQQRALEQQRYQEQQQQRALEQWREKVHAASKIQRFWRNSKIKKKLYIIEDIDESYKYKLPPHRIIPDSCKYVLELIELSN